MNISYTITVHPDVVPEGEKIRLLAALAKRGTSKAERDKTYF